MRPVILSLIQTILSAPELHRIMHHVLAGCTAGEESHLAPKNPYAFVKNKASLLCLAPWILYQTAKAMASTKVHCLIHIVRVVQYLVRFSM